MCTSRQTSHSKYTLLHDLACNIASYIAQVGVVYYHEPKVSENAAHECNNCQYAH